MRPLGVNQSSFSCSNSACLASVRVREDARREIRVVRARSGAPAAVVPRRTYTGLVVDPLDGCFGAQVRVEGGRIAAVERCEVRGDAPRILPGFVDLQIYDWRRANEHGVTGYLATCGTSARADVDRFLGSVADDPQCLGIHLEGPFINLGASGAQAPEHVRPVDLEELGTWLASRRVRMLTLAPEVAGAAAAIERAVAAGAVAALGHTLADAATTRYAVDAGARFATHVWNAMGSLRQRAPGAVGALLLDDRVTLGLIADGRHVHPLVEDLTVRAAGPARVALTSDLVSPPQARPDGSLLGGDRCGAALVRRMARHGLAEAALMASLVPARLLGLADRGRIAPGFRADLAVLDAGLRPLGTVVGGETAWGQMESK